MEQIGFPTKKLWILPDFLSVLGDPQALRSEISVSHTLKQAFAFRPVTNALAFPIHTVLTCGDGIADGHVRMGVGFARIRLACESKRIANPHHSLLYSYTVPTRMKRLWQGDSHNIKKACESPSDSRESVSFGSSSELRIRITRRGYQLCSLF